MWLWTQLSQLDLYSLESRANQQVTVEINQLFLRRVLGNSHFLELTLEFPERNSHQRSIFVLSSTWSNQHQRCRCVTWRHRIPQLGNWQGQCLLYTAGRMGVQYVCVDWLTDTGHHVGFHVFKRWMATVFSYKIASSFSFQPSGSKGNWFPCMEPAFSWGNSLGVKNVNYIKNTQDEYLFWFVCYRAHLSPLQDNYS